MPIAIYSECRRFTAPACSSAPRHHPGLRLRPGDWRRNRHFRIPPRNVLRSGTRAADQSRTGAGQVFSAPGGFGSRELDDLQHVHGGSLQEYLLNGNKYSCRLEVVPNSRSTTADGDVPDPPNHAGACGQIGDKVEKPGRMTTGPLRLETRIGVCVRSQLVARCPKVVAMS